VCVRIFASRGWGNNVQQVLGAQPGGLSRHYLNYKSFQRLHCVFAFCVRGEWKKWRWKRIELKLASRRRADDDDVLNEGCTHTHLHWCARLYRLCLIIYKAAALTATAFNTQNTAKPRTRSPYLKFNPHSITTIVKD